MTVYGDYYAGPASNAPFIVCFHMARSNRAEYDAIAPRLVDLGFQVLAIDQRSGGYAYKRMNETAKAYGKPASYTDAIPDLEAAIAWATARSAKSKLLVWGSSYSAALVILLAPRHPEIDGVLSFSPGEYLGGNSPVADAAAQLQQPIFVTSSRPEADPVKPIFEAIAAKDKTQFIPKGYGEHGSAALNRPDPEPAEYWTAIIGFLAKFGGAVP